jgi:hypothetical protein
MGLSWSWSTRPVCSGLAARAEGESNSSRGAECGVPEGDVVAVGHLPPPKRLPGEELSAMPLLVGTAGDARREMASCRITRELHRLRRRGSARFAAYSGGEARVSSRSTAASAGFTVWTRVRSPGNTLGAFAEGAHVPGAHDEAYTRVDVSCARASSGVFARTEQHVGQLFDGTPSPRRGGPTITRLEPPCR